MTCRDMAVKADSGTRVGPGVNKRGLGTMMFLVSSLPCGVWGQVIFVVQASPLVVPGRRDACTTMKPSSKLLPIKTTAYGRATLGAKPFRRAPFAFVTSGEILSPQISDTTDRHKNTILSPNSDFSFDSTSFHARRSEIAINEPFGANEAATGRIAANGVLLIRPANSQNDSCRERFPKRRRRPTSRLSREP